MKHTKIIIYLIILTFCGSCAIPKYSETKITPDIDGIYVTRVPSDIVIDYDQSLADSWTKTFNRSMQIKAAIDKEIDNRDARQTNIRRILTGTGGVSGLTIAIYSLAVTNPSTAVIGILGIISGTTFTTSLGFLKDDERATSLQEKSKKLELLRQEVEIQLSVLERIMAEKGLLVGMGKNNINIPGVIPDPEIVSKVKEIESQIIVFREALSKWDQEAK